MIKRILPLFFLLLLSSTGCLGSHSSGLAEIKDDSEGFADIQQLKKGGKLLIVPFSAGENVQATSDLDQVALMIVRGAADEFKKLDAPFSVLDSQTADSAEFILQGHITKQGESRSVNKWIFMNRKIYLGVSVELIDSESGKRLLIYSKDRQASKKASDFKLLGYQLGQDIAQVIVKGL